MFMKRVVSLGMMMLGSAIVIAAIGVQLQAEPSCGTKITYANSDCVPAHQLTPEPPGGFVGCESSYYFWCVPSAGSNCESVSRYGTAVMGQCVENPSEPYIHSCTSNVGVTPVVVEYFQSVCGFMNTCGCFWSNGGQPTVTVEVCDCADGPPL